MFNRTPRVYDRSYTPADDRRHYDEDAYQAGIQRRIQVNARVGRQRRWLAEDNTRNALIAALYEAANRAREGSFVRKMTDSYEEWGSLTAGQEAAVRRIVEQNAERQQQRTEQRAREAATSRHIGTLGKREDFTLTIRVVMEFDSNFGEGTWLLHIMHDAAGNVVVYKGSVRLGDKGETIRVKATVKEHGERDGCAQTVINRPKVLAQPGDPIVVGAETGRPRLVYPEAVAASAPENPPAAPVAPAIATPEVVEDARPVRGSLSALAAQVEQAAPVVEGPHCHRCGRQTEHHVPYCPVCNPIG